MTARKPPHTRQNRITKDLGSGESEDEELLPADAGEAPPAPPNLSDEVENAWESFWSIPPLAHKVAESDMLPLYRLFQLYEVYKRGIEDFMRDPYVEGARGSLVAHPGWGIANAAMRQILPLERQFGVTPKARAELGIVIDVPSNPAKNEGAMDFTGSDDLE